MQASLYSASDRSISARSPRPARLLRAVLGIVVLALSLAGAERAHAGTLVSMNYSGFGTVLIDLFDDLTPTTVNNFKQYINNNRYNNTMIHRVDTSLGVIQGGGFDTSANAVSTFPNIPLEYNRANTRGTISMARYYDPNTTATASSQWFINTDDNTSDLGPSNNGGYAVFGWVVGPGMNVIDNIAAVPTFEYASPFGQVPLTNFTAQDKENGANPLPHVVTLQSVTIIKTHPSFQNPWLAADVDNDGQLKAKDALTVINRLLLGGDPNLTGPFAGTNYLDTNGDGKVTAIDALRVINALMGTPEATPQMSPFAAEFDAAPLMIVPEPSSLALAGTAGLAAGAYLWRRRRTARRAKAA